MSPFIIYALPRSRTAWMASFLTYKDWRCLHEPAIRLRHISDIKQTFADKTGVIETGAAQAWPLIEHYVPGIKSVVVRRPTDEVVASMLAINMQGTARYDENRLRSIMAYGNRMLDQIAAKQGTLVIEFADLEKEETCKNIFEFCLPYEFDRAWWLAWKDRNVQVSVVEHLAYYHRNRWSITMFKRALKRDLIRLARAGAISKGVAQCHP